MAHVVVRRFATALVQATSQIPATGGSDIWCISRLCRGPGLSPSPPSSTGRVPARLDTDSRDVTSTVRAAILWNVAGGGGPARAALAHQRRARQVVVVDGGIEDGTKQRQVGVHRLRRQPLGDHRRLPGPDRAGVQVAERDVPEGRQDALLDLLSSAVLGGRMLRLPRRRPFGGHVLPKKGPGLLEVYVSWRGRLLASALDRPLLGLGAAVGQEEAGGALPLAVLVADLVALMREAGGWGDNGDPDHVPCLLVTGTG